MQRQRSALPAKVGKDDWEVARFLAAFGIPIMMSRPTVGSLHAEDEWIDIKSMTVFYQIYDNFLIQKLKV